MKRFTRTPQILHKCVRWFRKITPLTLNSHLAKLLLQPISRLISPFYHLKPFQAINSYKGKNYKQLRLTSLQPESSIVNYIIPCMYVHDMYACTYVCVCMYVCSTYVCMQYVHMYVYKALLHRLFDLYHSYNNTSDYLSSKLSS